MKVVLDTNVFVSGVFFNGPPFEILKAWRAGKIQLELSLEILDEYRQVGEILAKDHPLIDLRPILDYVIERAEVVSSPRLPERVCSDPDDDKFLACALASGSNFVISGDRHLLKVSGYRNVEIIKPREFLDLYLQEKIF
jgi:putative PIN family toxin of toxin-antitoxin system